MFYNLYNLEIKNMIHNDVTIYVRKNETLKHSIKRHFPDYNGGDFLADKCSIVLIKDILVDDLFEYMKDWAKQ